MLNETGENRSFVVRHAPKMAHRICDELALLQNATDVLINDEAIPPAVRSSIESIKDRIGYTARIAWQFLGISNTQEGQWTTIDVRGQILNLAPLLLRLLGGGYDLEIALQGNLWPIRADTQGFEQIITNLVENARDAMPHGGTLRIQIENVSKGQGARQPDYAEIASDYVVIDVVDSGDTIPADTIHRVCEPLFTSRGKACPFRLASVAYTVRKFNGHTIVQSVASRTIFRVLLPRCVRKW